MQQSLTASYLVQSATNKTTSFEAMHKLLPVGMAKAQFHGYKWATGIGSAGHALSHS